MTGEADIRNHIKAVRQTRQITGAMYLLSASRMRQTIKRIEYNQRYMQRLRATLKDILYHAGEKLGHVYLSGHPKVKKRLFIVISSDKGLCGSYNHQLLDYADQQLRVFSESENMLAVIGIMGEEHFRSRGTEPAYLWRGVIQNPSMYNARRMAATVCEEYLAGRVDEVYVIFTQYKNAIRQEPVMHKLLPLHKEDFDDVAVEYHYAADILFEPSPEEVFGTLVPQFLIASLFNILIQSSTAEHASRMNAMQTATSNADDMIAELEKAYNAQRQQQITNELAEIAAATDHILGI